jgi:hypothetical protein
LESNTLGKTVLNNREADKSKQSMRHKITMRALLVLTCCLALAGLVRAEPPDKSDNSPKKKKGDAAASEQAVVKPGKQAAGKAPRAGMQRKLTTQGSLPAVQSNRQLKKQRKLETQSSLPAVQSNRQIRKQQKLETQGSLPAAQSNRQLRKQQKLETQGNLPAVQSAQKAQIRQFNFSKSAKREVAAVKFRENNRIIGSENWRGEQYNVFRTYRAQWHDRDWWHHHHNRIVFVFGGWYFWNSGFWYPAWGYDRSAYYAYDGPIYAYNDLPPDQVTANVQASLQEQGYYHGEVDGLLGPLTRAALADYQRDHGLYTTSAIDQPTLASLGFV